MAKDMILIGLAGATLAVVGYVAAVVGPGPAGGDTDLGEQLASIDQRLDRLESIEKDVQQLRASVDRKLDGFQARVSRDVERATARDGAAPSGMAGAADAPPALDAEGNAVPLEEAIASRVEKRIGERMEKLAGRERNGQGEWKAPIDELAKELELTEAQQREATAVFDEARDETFVLLRTMRLDGGSLLDDYVAALKNGGDPEGSTKEFFQRIFTEKLPGTDRTYLTELITLRTDVETALGRELEPAQMTKLGNLRVDLLDVKTGHDPIKEYVEAQLQ